MAMQRQLFRLTIDRPGILRRGDETVACQVVDLTEKGMRLRIEGIFSVGEQLRVQFPLTDADLLDCTIQVTHHRPPHLGAVIVRMAADDQQRLTAFIDQLNELNITGF